MIRRRFGESINQPFIEPEIGDHMETRMKMLKVKVKSLAEEARIIRREERLSRHDVLQRCELHTHRVHDVRREQRLSYLAYAFLRGVPLYQVEPKRSSEPDWNRVAKLVDKFGTTSWKKSDREAQQQRLEEWRVFVAVE